MEHTSEILLPDEMAARETVDGWPPQGSILLDEVDVIDDDDTVGYLVSLPVR